MFAACADAFLRVDNTFPPEKLSRLKKTKKTELKDSTA